MLELIGRIRFIARFLGVGMLRIEFVNLSYIDAVAPAQNRFDEFVDCQRFVIGAMAGLGYEDAQRSFRVVVPIPEAADSHIVDGLRLDDDSHYFLGLGLRPVGLYPCSAAFMILICALAFFLVVCLAWTPLGPVTLKPFTFLIL
jgi:hypothetical protein